MTTLSTSLRLLTVAAVAALTFQAPARAADRPMAAPLFGVTPLAAAFIDVNLAGFRTFGDFGDPLNSQVFLSIAPGSTVLGYDYSNLSFATSGPSWLSEFTLSVNNANGTAYLDALPSDTDDSGSFGPASGTWQTALGGFGGAPFVATNGTVWVTVYEQFTDPGVNATVSAGTLRIYYDTPAVPEPATYGLMGLGLLVVAGAARRSRSH